MQTRRYLFSALVIGAAYVAIAGCGDDDESTPEPAADAAPETTTIDTFVPMDTSVVDVANDRGNELTGQACMAVSDCYPGLDAGSLKGEVKCLDRVSNGYCTHVCTQDSDCCSTPGECRTGLKQVCAPLESAGEKYCFISCEPDDIASATDAGVDAGTTETEYCERSTSSSEFSCRSSGGGVNNRKVCLPKGAPGDGGMDASDAADSADGDGG
jgi:hypothetical protein